MTAATRRPAPLQVRGDHGLVGDRWAMDLKCLGYRIRSAAAAVAELGERGRQPDGGWAISQPADDDRDQRIAEGPVTGPLQGNK